MNSKVQLFKGILRIEGRHCYLASDTAAGRPFRLFLNVPIGAAVFDGFTKASDYFQQTMRKDDGDRISIHGVKFCFAEEVAIQFSLEDTNFQVSPLEDLQQTARLLRD